MDWKRRLADNLTVEAQAYGYTLTIWGAGAILISANGVPDPLSIFAYVGGALAGYGALVVVAFDGVFAEREPGEDTALFAASTVHVVATLGNLVVTYAFAVASARLDLPAPLAFFLVGAQATATYNLFLLLEDYVVRQMELLGESGEPGD